MKRFHFKSRRYMLLVELLIALGLTMTVLSITMIFYDQIERINTALEKEQNRSFRKLYLSTRLASVIPKAVSASDPEGDFFFFTTSPGENFALQSSPGLLFAFDNGVKLDPDFSNHVIGRLYVNKNHQLCLATWPSPLRWNEITPPPMKNEILYENVNSLKFEFYVPPARDRQMILSNHKPKVDKSGTLLLDVLGGWKTEWEQEYKDLPAMIKISIGIKAPEGTEEIVLAYPLPSSHLIIVYDR